MWRAINRRIFINAAGRLGMGPYGTRTGDYVGMLLALKESSFYDHMEVFGG